MPGRGHSIGGMDFAKPSSKPYFFGRISRDEAERFLKTSGCAEGLFLLRESISTSGNYALSICHQGRIHHYSIEKQPNGQVMIQDGRRFPGPIELIEHHKKNLEGFLTKPTTECQRPSDGYPLAWPGVTYFDLEFMLNNLAEQKGLKGTALENALGPQRQHFINQIAKTLHESQPWFHGRIEREEADRIMTASQHKDGKYLVREKADGTFALSLSHKNATKHYLIEKHKTGSGDKLAIEEGDRFDSLMDMIANYHNKSDGLLCKLSVACYRANFTRQNPRRPAGSTQNTAYGMLPDMRPKSVRELPAIPPPLPPTRPPSTGILGNGNWDDPAENDAADPLRNGFNSNQEDLQKIYDTHVPRTDEVFNLNKANLEFKEKLGAGNFGAVMKGVFRRDGNLVPVAIKTLKQDDLPNAESEIMKEARLMADLQHRNIVRLIGVCKSDMIMLVMELAEFGPLNKYLKVHKEMKMPEVLELMFQVAEGMAYLESKNFVHRDLAARNVLLVNPTFAKISDFGMSKALGMGGEYYKAESAGKWPLKWYAPECIYYFKFDSKSDIWSYGVTLWEATSYGNRPYRGLKGQQILELIEKGARLDKPDKCPPGVYEIMIKCWEFNKDDRPTFKELVDMLRKYRS